jgi:hypothetical protein
MQRARTTLPSCLALVLPGLALPACIGFASVSDENAYAVIDPGNANVGDAGGRDDPVIPESTDDPVSSQDCRNIPWGTSCSEGTRIYNVTFPGMVVASMEEKDISLEDIRCDGYDSVLLFAGDTS